MTFDWKEYLKLARILYENNTAYNQEAGYRSAVSRAYFAAFCFVRNYARDYEDLGEKLKGDARDHTIVREHYQNTHPQLVAYLGQLRQWRNDCDYKDRYRGLQILAPEAIEYAQEIIDELK